ncbi:MAG: flagellar biosynthetic protein FliR [Bacillota bacterium]|nr:flagellar biosynthetic protein FliR [Bacillota bacterium]MDW7683000.1 flagellar biosynthetic protein FliR [Bacillota bacterium]
MSTPEWSVLFLIFVRLSAIIAVLPFFAWRGVPNLAKVGFAALFSYLLYLVHGPFTAELPEHFFNYILAVGSEALFGMTIGFLVLLLFTAVRIAGQMVDLQSGLMSASLLDPQFGDQVTIYGQFYYMFAVVFYLSVNGHHLLFLALARSVNLVAPGGVVFSPQLIPQFMQFIFQMFIIAFQLAAPVVAVLVFSDLVLGLLSKTVPQIHVFMVGMPLKAGVALFITFLIFPYFAQVLETVFGRLQQDITLLLSMF